MASDQSNNISETQSKSISDTPSNSISDSFTTISGRQSRRAEEYFTSDRFISQLKEKIERDLIRGKDNYAELQYPDVDATRNDMPLLQLA
ncbi:MAG TPA: hypothetical protein VFA15_00770, partial [Nitrososphaera sp.]|nr:hypothetical protein [Nitrososphaera sp.]